MLDSFTQGGWGMYPTLLLGCFLAVSVARLLATPTRRSTVLVALSAGLVLLSGTLGFTMGFVRTLQAAGNHDPRLIYIGTAESLNNVMLALLIVLIAGISTAAGLWWRRERQPRAIAPLDERPSPTR